MITKIINTPLTSGIINLFQTKECCKPRKAAPAKVNTSLSADTVTFTSNSKKAEELINFAFKKLAENRKGEALGEYMGKAGNTNFYFRETSLGKKAELNITKNGNFQNFEISRTSDRPIKIKSLDYDNMSSREAAKIVTSQLQGLK